MNEAQRISICHGRLIDPANGVDGLFDLHIEEGRILAVGAAPAGFHADLIIPAGGMVVCPGLIDLAARLREPGSEHKATIASETAAAVAGGITTLCCPPDTQPIIDTPAVAELIRQRAEQADKARVLPMGAMTRRLAGDQLSDMVALREAGCIAISNADQPLKNTLVERRALEYAATFGLICLLQPIDHALQDGGCAHEGRIGTLLGLPGIPEAAETVALARDLVLAEQFGAQVHFHGLSSAAGAVLFGRSRYENPRISADVAIHHLHLTEDDLEGFDSNCHLIPPLRTSADREALRQAVADGRIEAICSDHQPHEPDAKRDPFPATEPGISGLETLLSLTLRLVEQGMLDLSTALERLTWGPARILGLPLGRLEVGRAADLCIFDPAECWRVDSAAFLSRGHNTPFHGWELPGRVHWTLRDGRVVFQLSLGEKPI
jgi:dihydroorotase